MAWSREAIIAFASLFITLFPIAILLLKLVYRYRSRNRACEYPVPEVLRIVQASAGRLIPSIAARSLTNFYALAPIPVSSQLPGPFPHNEYRYAYSLHTHTAVYAVSVDERCGT